MQTNQDGENVAFEELNVPVVCSVLSFQAGITLTCTEFASVDTQSVKTSF